MNEQDVEHTLERHEEDITQLRADLSEAKTEIATLTKVIASLAPALRALDGIVVNSHTNMLHDTPAQIKDWQAGLAKAEGALKAKGAS